MEESKNGYHFELACKYQRKKNYSLAIKEHQEALKMGFDPEHIHKDLGRIYREQAQYDSSMKEFYTALELNTGNGEINAEIGRVYERKKEYGSAVKEFKLAVKKGYDTEDVHKDLGRIYCEQGKYDLAIEEFQKALRLNPNRGEFHAGLGIAYYEQGKYDLAEKEIRIAIKKGYNTQDVHMNLGKIYCDEGKYDLAIEELEKAILLGLDNEEVHLKLGRIYRKRGEYNLSVKEFERVIEVSSYKDEPFLKNKILNEIEISQKKTVLKSRFRSLHIILTSKCNLKCIMCLFWRDSWEIPERTIREIEDTIPYLARLYWQGGEVFLSKYFEPLFDKASQYPYLRQEISTNGLLIDQKWAEKFVRANLNLIYSIDGTTKKTYEYIRKGAKFEELLKSICLINEEKRKYKNKMADTARMTTSIYFVVMKTNYKELEGVIEFAKEYEFDELTLAPVSFISTEENIFLHKNMEAKKYIDETIPRIQKKADDYGIVLCNCLPAIGNCKEEKSNNNSVKRKILCYWPWQHLFIDVDGKVKPHCLCEKEVGNVIQSSLEEIWNNDMMQYYRKKILEGDYKGLCNKICLTSPEDRMEIPW